MVLNASYVCMHAFSLHRESPDLDPERRTPHFWGGSIKVGLDAMVWAWDGIVETVGIRSEMWFVMLESAEDWVLGVDT
jgi:hypothetical protein